MSWGLRGVVAGETAISTVADGHGLYYRGYEVSELCARASFDETAYLLLRGELPTKGELADYRHYLASLAELPETVEGSLRLLPESAHPMDVLCNAVSQLGVAAPEKEITPEISSSGIRKTTRTTTRSTGSLA